MSNPFYNYDNAFIPGQLARAEAVAAEFLAVQAGFVLLSYDGTDSGTANTYVIATGGAPTGAYSNAQIVRFQALNGNTGAATINVNSVGVVPLTRFDGSPLQSADISAGMFVTAQYDATGMKFRVTSPAAYTASGTVTVSHAAPTNKVGLVAAGGASNAVTPIDATYAIDQAIVPTWTGLHTFSAGLSATTGNFTGTLTGVAGTFSGVVSSTAGISATGGSISITRTVAGAGSTVQATNNDAVSNNSFAQFAATNSAHSLHVLITGTAQSGAFITGGLSSEAAYLYTDSGVPLCIGTAGVVRMTLSTTGNITTAAPSSGAAITVGAVDNAAGVVLNDASLTNGTYFGIQNNGTLKASFALGAVAGGSAGANDASVLSVSGAIRLTVSNGTAVSVASAGNVTVAAPSSGNALTVSQFSSTPAIMVSGSGTTVSLLDTGAAAARLDIATSNTKTTLNFTANTTSTPGAIQMSGVDVISISTSRNVTVGAPSSGIAFQVNGLSGGITGLFQASTSSGNSQGLRVYAGTTSADIAFLVNNAANTVNYLEVRGDGLVQAVDEGGSLQDVGWRGVPQNSTGGSYTAVLADRGKSVVMVSSGATFTIPANASVAYPLGTVLTVVNNSAGSISVAINTDSLVLAGTGTSGTRTLASNGMATALKVASTTWFISGAGIS